jgi:hypothetical protein
MFLGLMDNSADGSMVLTLLEPEMVVKLVSASFHEINNYIDMK